MDFWIIILLIVLLASTGKQDSEGDKWRKCLFQLVVITNITVGILLKS
ncbi:hypothetical protein AAHH67_16145 [Niallia circulans]